MRSSRTELIREFIFFVVFVLLILIFFNFILDNLNVLGVALLFFLINFIVIFFHERKYGQKNFPYKPYKSKNKISKRILLGLLAGLHYFFFIGSYNHKKYNTQVWYPETIECIFGNISQGIIFLAYVFISVDLFEVAPFISVLFMVLPIITNLISLINSN
ncbi:MAG: hypothetical protein ABIJ14_03915 [Nanoarchaeota archaeon]